MLDERETGRTIKKIEKGRSVKKKVVEAFDRLR